MIVMGIEVLPIKINNEAASSLNESFEERVSSPMYGTFAIAWVIWNWEAIYTTFFINDDLLYEIFEITKLEYIQTIYPFSTFYEVFISFLKLAIGPFLSVLVYFWVLSWIANKIFAKDLSIKAGRTVARKRVEQDIERLALTHLDIREKQVEKKVEIQEKEKELTKSWNIEYQKLKRNKDLFNNFSYIFESIYNHYGDVTRGFGDGRPRFEIPSSMLAYADSNDLVLFSSNRRGISLTDKGKHFMSRYISDRDKI